MSTFQRHPHAFSGIKRKITTGINVLMLLIVIPFTSSSLAARPEIVVAISTDMPPYVIDKATRGLQVDIVTAALEDYAVRFVQVPYGELQTAVQKNQAQVSVGVMVGDSEVFYSSNFITFSNVAISKKSDNWKIEQVADLKNHPVLTWQNAYLELGPEFERLFSPQSPQRKNYVEVADQSEQVKMFWQDEGSIIVIDRSIFTNLSRELEYSIDKVIFHHLFPPVTNFKASFKDSELRDNFNKKLILLCESGKYEKFLSDYGIELQDTICN
ncbi:transporter substrate-binding domain-containing protein [Photobacterium sagamiensis]|uniref:substrate-binding periplasmic protein n=1 Tax=Photobacterium sagamiensis TaxID=2910241 RepID=UPI003D0CBAF0